jgi:hypothetical protein
MPDSSSSEDEEELKRLQAVSVTGQDIAAAAVIPSRKKVGLCIACMTAHGLILHLSSPLGADILSWCKRQRKRRADDVANGGTNGTGIVEDKVGRARCEFASCVHYSYSVA